MGQFEDKLVHSSKDDFVVRGPLQREFSVESWEAAWRRLRTDQSDDRLYSSGLWMHRRWDGLQQYRFQLEAMLPNANLKHHLFVWLNEQIRLNKRQTEERLEKLATASGEKPNLFATALSRSEGQNPISVDALTTLCGDAVSVIIGAYPDDTPCWNYDVYRMIRPLGEVFLNLAQLIQRWEACLRLGVWVEEKEDMSVFFLPRLDYAISEAVATDRRINNEAHLIGLYSEVWSNQRWLLRPICPTVVDAVISDGKLTCRLDTNRSTMLFTSALRRLAEIPIPPKLKELPLEKLHGLTLIDLLNTYEVLSSLGLVILDRQLEFADPKSSVYDEALPRLRTDDLCRLLQKAHGWSKEKAQAGLDAFLYEKGARDGSWSRPLIPAGSGYVHVLLPVILSHPARLVEHWLIKGEPNSNKRGRPYEQFVRERLAEAISRNPILRSKASVLMSDINIRTHLGKRDLDLVLMIGSTILIAEVKSASRPAMPWETRTFIDEVLVKAPQQVQLRMNAIETHRENKNLIASRLGLKNLDGIKLVHCVLAMQDEATGCHVRGTPIVDFSIVEDYLLCNTYGLGWSGSAAQSSAEHELELYSDAGEAGDRLEVYLRNPPHYVARQPLISSNPIRGNDVIPGSQKQIWSEQRFVSTLDGEKMVSSAEYLRNRWENLIADMDAGRSAKTIG